MERKSRMIRDLQNEVRGVLKCIILPVTVVITNTIVIEHMSLPHFSHHLQPLELWSSRTYPCLCPAVYAYMLVNFSRLLPDNKHLCSWYYWIYYQIPSYVTLCLTWLFVCLLFFFFFNSFSWSFPFSMFFLVVPCDDLSFIDSVRALGISDTLYLNRFQVCLGFLLVVWPFLSELFTICLIY